MDFRIELFWEAGCDLIWSDPFPSLRACLASIHSQASIFQSEINCAVTVTAACLYYNPCVAAWEPLLEPSPLDFRILRNSSVLDLALVSVKVCVPAAVDVSVGSLC